MECFAPQIHDAGQPATGVEIVSIAVAFLGDPPAGDAIGPRRHRHPAGRLPRSIGPPHELQRAFANGNAHRVVLHLVGQPVRDEIGQRPMLGVGRDSGEVEHHYGSEQGTSQVGGCATQPECGFVSRAPGGANLPVVRPAVAQAGGVHPAPPAVILAGKGEAARCRRTHLQVGRREHKIAAAKINGIEAEGRIERNRRRIDADRIGIGEARDEGCADGARDD